MTTTEDTIPTPPGRAWTRESSRDVLERFAETTPHHMTESSGSQQLALLLQVFCKELLALRDDIASITEAGSAGCP